jgi:hypothetical protein
MSLCDPQDAGDSIGMRAGRDHGEPETRALAPEEETLVLTPDRQTLIDFVLTDLEALLANRHTDPTTRHRASGAVRVIRWLLAALRGAESGAQGSGSREEARLRSLLVEARGCIVDAIYNDDGCDASDGEPVVQRIDAALRRATPAPTGGDARGWRSDPLVEAVAEAIYDAMRENDPKGKNRPWVPGGNSDKQDEARSRARRATFVPDGTRAPTSGRATAVEQRSEDDTTCPVCGGAWGDGECSRCGNHCRPSTRAELLDAVRRLQEQIARRYAAVVTAERQLPTNAIRQRGPLVIWENENGYAYAWGRVPGEDERGDVGGHATLAELLEALTHV